MREPVAFVVRGDHGAPVGEAVDEGGPGVRIRSPLPHSGRGRFVMRVRPDREQHLRPSAHHQHVDVRAVVQPGRRPNEFFSNVVHAFNAAINVLVETCPCPSCGDGVPQEGKTFK